MDKINIVGLGPGHKDYIIPAALKKIEESDVVFSGKRGLESVNVVNKKVYEIGSDLNKMIFQIEEEVLAGKIVTVVASGDPTFYGIVNFVTSKISSERLCIIPGVSSIQYMCAKIGLSWHDAYLGSVHGREESIKDLCKNYNKIILLTDKKRNCHYIAEEMTLNGYGERFIYIGEFLSYDNEEIIKLRARELVTLNKKYELTVVVIYDK